LVNNPDAVVVDRRIDEKGVLLELTVDPEDLGRVIGKRGATAQSLRTLLRALGTKNDARYNLKIVDVEGGDRRPRQNDQESQRSDENDSAEKSSEPEASEVNTPDEEVEEPEEPEEENDRLAKTRQELADLDDLDV